MDPGSVPVCALALTCFRTGADCAGLDASVTIPLNCLAPSDCLRCCTTMLLHLTCNGAWVIFDLVFTDFSKCGRLVALAIGSLRPSRSSGVRKGFCPLCLISELACEGNSRPDFERHLLGAGEVNLSGSTFTGSSFGIPGSAFSLQHVAVLLENVAMALPWTPDCRQSYATALSSSGLLIVQSARAT